MADGDDAEVPSNMLLKNFTRPSIYLGILITCWGIIMTLTGVVKGYAGLLVVRVLLGIFEYVPVHPINTQILIEQGRLLPRCRLPLYILVHAQKPLLPPRLLLLRQCPIRRILRPSRRSNRENERRRWICGLALDFHH